MEMEEKINFSPFSIFMWMQVGCLSWIVFNIYLGRFVFLLRRRSSSSFVIYIPFEDIWYWNPITYALNVIGFDATALCTPSQKKKRKTHSQNVMLFELKRAHILTYTRTNFATHANMICIEWQTFFCNFTHLMHTTNLIGFKNVHIQLLTLFAAENVKSKGSDNFKFHLV